MEFLAPSILAGGSNMNGSVLATLSDIPTELPANGGNSDTVDGKHAVDFTPIAHVGSGGSAHALATPSVSGFMSAAQASKLNLISAEAKKVEDSTANGNILIDGSETNVYTHPASHSAAMITEDASRRFVTDTNISYWNAKLDGTANAVSSSKWATARTLSLTGDASGSVVIDGSANATLTVTVTDDSHNHIVANVDGLQTALDSKETPAGAQAKADASENNARVNSVPRFSTRISSIDLNNYDTAGLYALGASLANAPLNSSYGTLLVSNSSTDRITQVVFAPSVDKMYMRYGRGSSGSRMWSDWFENETTIGSQAKVNAHEANTTIHITGAERTNWNAKLDGADNAVSASKWQTARTVSLSGDATGSVSIDGSANATLAVTVVDDSHNHIIANVDGLQTALDAKLDETANAVSSSKWATARTLSLTGDATGSVVIDGSANATLTVTVADDSHNHIVANVDGLQTALDAKETPAGAQAKATAAESAAKSYAFSLNTINILDRRDANDPPGYYSDPDNGRRIHSEFKRIATIGLPAGAEGTYCTLFTDARWVGSSGGRKNQWVFTDSGKMFLRVGSVDETTWGPWEQIAFQSSVDEKLDDGSAAISASKWTTARTLSLSGDATGSVSIDGSANATLAVTVADDSHNHIIANVDGLQTELDAKETPAGAQTKATAAETSAKSYASNTVSVGSTADPDITQEAYILTNHANGPGLGVYWHIRTFFYSSKTGNRGQLAISYNGSVSRAMIRHHYSSWTQWEELYSTGNVEELGADLSEYESFASGYNSTYDVFTVVDYKRNNGTLFLKSTLSGLSAGNYTTDTWQYYNDAGTAVIKTVTWTITYDSNGNVVNKTFA